MKMYLKMVCALAIACLMLNGNARVVKDELSQLKYPVVGEWGQYEASVVSSLEVFDTDWMCNSLVIGPGFDTDVLDFADVTVSGLPPGVKLEKASYSYNNTSIKMMLCYGTPTKPGVYTVTINVKYQGKTYQSIYEVVVKDAAARVCKVVSLDTTKGTVSGGGAYKVGSTMTISAKAKSGYVFAGWYEDEQCMRPASHVYVPDPNGLGIQYVDHRMASQKWAIYQDEMSSGYFKNPPDALYARFVAKEEDSSIVIDDRNFLDGMSRLRDAEGNLLWRYRAERYSVGESVSADEGTYYSFYVKSLSMPTVSVKGLPSQLVFSSNGGYLYSSSEGEDGCEAGFIISQKNPLNPASIDPGEYRVTLSLKNVSGATATEYLTIRVPNYDDGPVGLDYDEPRMFKSGVAVDELHAEWIGWSVTGLPKGLTFDSKTGRLSGTPSEAGKNYTVWFKKDGRVGTVVYKTEPFPEVAILCEGDSSGCKVTGEGAFKPGSTVTLAATTPKGTAFLGWFDESGMVSDSARYAFTMPDDDVVLTAWFDKEKISVACEGLSSGSFVAGVAGPAGGIPLEIETQSGVKSVAVKFTPSCGLTYDAKKQLITGAPTKTGEVKAEITVTAVSGAVEKKTITLSVVALPDMAVGTFNGFVGKTANDEFTGHGTFTLTSTDAGKLTAKITDATGSYSFSAASWDSIAAGVCAVKLSTKKGEVLNLSLDTTAAWNAYQLTGSFIAGGKTYEVSAQRKAFGAPWYFTATGNAENGWTLEYASSAKEAALTVTMNADGTTALAGTLGGNKISASGSVDVSGMANEVLFADFVPVVSVKSGKSTVKKSMYVRSNLWFDRKSDHEVGVGSAKFVE